MLNRSINEMGRSLKTSKPAMWLGRGQKKQTDVVPYEEERSTRQTESKTEVCQKRSRGHELKRLPQKHKFPEVIRIFQQWLSEARQGGEA